MKSSHIRALVAVGAMPDPQAAPQPRDAATGRFAATEVPPGFSLNGGPTPPPPPAPRSPEVIESEHSQLMAAMAQAPRQLPNLERA